MTYLIFFGSDQYSAVVLSCLISNSTLELAVVTDPHIPPSPVETLARQHSLPVSYYPSLPQLPSPDQTIGLCASFDHLLPKDIITQFQGNLYNLHPSLLPQYRNVSPVQYALALGDKTTGITLFRISDGIDNGEVIGQISDHIQQIDTTPTLTSRLFSKGAELFLQAFSTNFTPASPARATNKPLIFTHRLTRQSGFIEWEVLNQLLTHHAVKPVTTINELLKLRLTHNPQGNILSDLLRALSPWPGIWTNAPTKKGELRLSLESVNPALIKIAGKPKPITLADFTKYYL